MTFLKRLLMALGGLFAVLILGVVALVFFYPGLHSSSIEMALNVITGKGSDRPEAELLSRLEAADGYTVSIFARDLPHPRMLARDGDNRLLVSNPRAGAVILLADTDGDGAADSRTELLTDLNRPHGLALHDGYLYVAESDKVGRVPFSAGQTSGDYEIIADGFTDGGNHWTKSIAFGPDGHVYLAMGSTCNVCVEEDERRATIMRFAADGSDGRIYASGLRNSVGLAFAPWSGELYATDNGRDLLGDDYPPCELNRVVDGGFYGWPYLNGANEKDPDFGDQREDLQATALPPVLDFPAHNAPLGIFFNEDHSALVALHGSWNRSQPDGYKLVRVHWRGDQVSSEDFMTGFEKDGDIVGRPVDIVDDGEGGYFVSDDYAKVVYRLSRNRNMASAAVASSSTLEAASLDTTLASAGQALYQEFGCDSCHGAAAATPVALDELASKYGVSSLADYFLTPTPPMPTYPLDEAQREQLAHFLLSRG